MSEHSFVTNNPIGLLQTMVRDSATEKVVIYHKDCFDGLASAVVACLFQQQISKLGRNSSSFSFYPAEYSSDSIHGIDVSQHVKDKDVLILDFSYSRDNLIKISKLAKRVVLIDHHQFNVENLKELPENVGVVFNNDYSGAGLTWKVLFEGLLDHSPYQTPAFVKLIEDHDLWRFNSDYTGRFIAKLGIDDLFSKTIYQATNYFVGLGLLNSLDQIKRSPGLYDTFVSIINEGQIAITVRETMMADIIRQTLRHTTFFEGKSIPVANVPKSLSNETGHILSKDHPFSITYYDTDWFRVFSFRSSIDTGEDVRPHAARLGGGGHKHASGAKVPHNDPRSVFVAGIRNA